MSLIVQSTRNEFPGFTEGETYRVRLGLNIYEAILMTRVKRCDGVFDLIWGVPK